MSLDSIQQARRKMGFERSQAFLGRAVNGARSIRDATGRYYVRPQLPSGALGPAIPLPLDQGVSLPAKYNLAVEIGFDKTGQQVIFGVNYETAIKQGLNPASLNLADPAASGFTRTEKLASLYTRAHPAKSGYAQVFPGFVVFGSTPIRYEGGEIDVLTTLKPSSSQHRYVVVALEPGGSLDASGSTAQSTGTDLDDTDIAEAFAGLANNAKPLKIFRVTGTDTKLNDSPYDADRNPNGAMDWRLYGPQGASAGNSGGSGDYIHLRDEKTQNTAGGTFTSGAWRTRDLNTEVSDTGGHAGISSNQISLAAGTYRVWISVPAYFCDRHQARLYNITDSAVVVLDNSKSALGTAEYSPASGAASVTRSIIEGRFTIGGTKTLEVQHQCQTTKADNGFGVEANFTTEVYTVVRLWRE